MSIPKAVGIETEYGIVVHTIDQSETQNGSDTQAQWDTDPIQASQTLLGQLPSLNLVTVPHSDFGYDPPAQKGRAGKSGGPNIFKVDAQPRYGDGNYDWMLANGGRIYIDHAHPEYCTPECRSLRTLIAADKAGEIILERCCQAVVENKVLPPGTRILLYKNNSDHKGNSYGCHENYLLKSSLYEDLLYHQPHFVTAYLLPFLITRIIYCGAGKVGSENGTPAAGFQLSQRADFFETLRGIQTTHNRPLFNIRDEAHAASAKYRRLHVIVGDANMAELSTYLKIGPMLILFRMLEDGFISTDFSLVDPLNDFQTVSRDLSLKEKLALKSGEKLTALEIQRKYLALARKYLKNTRSRKEEHEIVKQWASVLDLLESDWRQLASGLDWAIKRRLLEHYLSSKQTTWDEVTRWQPTIDAVLAAEMKAMAGSRNLGPLETNPDWQATLRNFLAKKNLSVADYTSNLDTYFGLRGLDLEYHDIRRGPAVNEMGLFYRLQSRNLVKRIVSDAEISRLVAKAPIGTRAWFRGNSLEQFSQSIAWSDWSLIAFSNNSTSEDSYDSILVMDNPASDYRKDARKVWKKLAQTYRNGKAKD